MVDCVVCRYWSERLEETRTHGGAKSALEQEIRLMVTLRTHQFGVWARRFPYLPRYRVKRELEVPNRTPGFCDPTCSNPDIQAVRRIRSGANLRVAAITPQGQFRYCSFSWARK
jgi:hypothetical protein